MESRVIRTERNLDQTRTVRWAVTLVVAGTEPIEIVNTTKRRKRLHLRLCIIRLIGLTVVGDPFNERRRLPLLYRASEIERSLSLSLYLPHNDRSVFQLEIKRTDRRICGEWEDILCPCRGLTRGIIKRLCENYARRHYIIAVSVPESADKFSRYNVPSTTHAFTLTSSSGRYSIVVCPCGWWAMPA